VRAEQLPNEAPPVSNPFGVNVEALRTNKQVKGEAICPLEECARHRAIALLRDPRLCDGVADATASSLEWMSGSEVLAGYEWLTLEKLVEILQTFLGLQRPPRR
jgi:hypothetical protein